MAMLLPVLGAIGVGGLLARARPGDGLWISGVALALVWMTNARGFYWSVFPRGEGFFTANRISANIVFVLVALATAAMVNNKKKARQC